jgi:hypothetical protein
MTSTALARAATKPFTSGIVCGGGGEEKDKPLPACASSQLIMGGGTSKSKL